jgi:uncharacterized protein with PQ loop repeat
MWPDVVLFVCGCIFAYGLIPQIIKNKQLNDASFISWQLCILYSIAVLGAGVACLALELYITCISNVIQLVCWGIIIYQKLYYKGN